MKRKIKRFLRLYESNWKNAPRRIAICKFILRHRWWNEWFISSKDIREETKTWTDYLNRWDKDNEVETGGMLYRKRSGKITQYIKL